jgi:polyhydroxyalkanoate synthesis regulator phasin
MRLRTKTLIASLMAVMLLGNGLWGGIALAQTPTPPNPPSGQSAASPSPGDVFWSALAAKLGTNIDNLKAAFRDAAKAVVAQRVKDGKLTQAQADQLNQRIDKLPLKSMPLPILPRRQGMTPQQKIAAAAAKLMLDAAANTLGMSSRDLLGELRDGLTLAEIAQQKGIDPNKLKTAMLAAVNARIDEAVKNGRLTQDKTNELKAKLAEKLDLNKRFPLSGKTQPPKSKP